MIPALIIATVLYIGAWSKQSRMIYYLSIMLMFLFVALRNPDMCGYDSISYSVFFNSVPTLDDFNWKFWDSSFMYGYGWTYALLNSIAKTIYNNYFSFQIFDTIIVFSLLLLIIKKLKLKYSEKCFFMFVYFCSRFTWYFFILLRQNLANLLVWYVFVDWEPDRKHKWYKYLRDLMLIIIATSIHSTAAFAFVIYPVYIIMYKFKEKTIVKISIVFAIIITAVSSFIMPYIWNIVGMFSGERYLAYENWGAGGINIINYALRIAYLILILWKGRQFYKYRFSLNCTALALVVGGVNTTFNVRMVEYFAVGYYSAMSHIKGYFKGNQWVILGAYIIYILMLLQYIIVNNPEMINYRIY